MSKPSAKQIVVLEKSGYTIEVLRQILLTGGKENYSAVSAGITAPPGMSSSVLLVCDPEYPAEAPGYGACVADYETACLPGFACLRNLTTYSIDRDSADFTAKNIRTSQDGITAFEIVGSGIIGRVRLGPGMHGGVQSALAAASAAVAAGIPFADVLSALNGIGKIGCPA